MKKNTIHFERLQCNSYANFVDVKCNMKRISRNYLQGYLNITLSRPVKELWIHGVFFLKYNLYQKFPIDLWENLCGWLNKKSKSYLLDWGLKDLMLYTNLNHPCPYVGHAYVKVDNFSVKFNM